MVALLLAEQRLGDGRADRQLALAQVGLVFGHDGVDHLLAVVVVHQSHSTEDLHLALVDLRLVDHAGIGQRILHFGDAHFEQALRFARSVVLRILRKVALVAGLGDGRRNGGTLHRTHMIQFVLELLIALRRQINNLFCHNVSFPASRTKK